VKVGLLGDAHGQAGRTRAAVRLLIEHGAELLIYLGDVCGDAVIEALVEKLDDAGKPDPPVHLVFGNCDFNTAGSARYAASLGITVDDPAGRLILDGKTLAFTHGHLIQPMHDAIADGVDYLFHGHSHRRRDEHVQHTRVINPGALQRAAQYTVALLDTATDELQFVPVAAR